MVCIHCPLCCMRHFPTFIELKKHLIQYVEGDLKCPFCDHNAVGLENLLLHLNVHDDTVKDELLKENNSDFEPGSNMTNVEELEGGHENGVIDTIVVGNEHLEGYVNEDTMYYDGNESSNTRYTCGMCEIEFGSMDLLQEHAVDIHAISSVFIIEGCPNKDSEITLNGEVDNKEQEDIEFVKEEEEIQTLELMCDQCGKQYDKQSDLELHKYIHMDNSLWPFECPKCHRHFIDKDPFYQHLLTEHNKSSDLSNSCLNPEKCSICGKLYKSLEHLLVHIREKHERCFKCDQCDKVFVTERERKRHKVTVHDGRKFLCSVCGKKFHYKAGLRNHSKIHLPVRPFPCSVCEKRFIDASELRRHMLRHTGEKPHVCEICGIMFRERYRLNVHVRGHTGERPYACTKCDAAFTSGSSLRLHKLIHVEGKSYQCSYCAKVFKTPINLYNHMKLHTKPFKCDVCGRSFSSRVILRKHKRTHNKDYYCRKCGMEFTALRKLEIHEKTCGILEENDYDCSQFRPVDEQNFSIVHQNIENNSLHLS